MMYCKACGEQMEENQAVCLKCGVKTGEGDAYCANCGAALNPGADVCLTCGVAVNQPNKVLDGQIGGYDKITIALICFFLGGIGVHDFMMGETKKGIFKIVMTLCFGLSTIFALIDFIKILTNKYVVDPKKLI